MLESLAAWVLKHYLGKYVENLNTDQLSIGLLQGQVELENLPLKKDALRQVGLPIQVKAGFIGRIKLQIPFRQIRSAPWVIIIEKLYLVAGPVDLGEWEEESEEQALQDQKMHALEELEAQWRANAETQEQSYYASSYSSWMSFGTSIITNIVENLQSLLSFLFWLLIGERLYNEADFFKLNIADVHFRYEDSICIPGLCFTSGITIESLVAQSCNEKWEPGFASGQIGFKVVELSKFAIYWDDCSVGELLADKECTEFMNNMRSHAFRGRHFLLNHVSGVAHIKRNRSMEPLRSKSTPRIICDVLFDEFPIILSDKQYAQMILWYKGLSVINTRIQNRRIRPQTTVKEDPVGWWRYSCEAVLRRIKPNRYSWDIAVERTKENVSYVNLYQKILQNPNAPGLTDEEKNTKERIEFQQSFDELRVLREVAMRRTKPPPKIDAPKIVVGQKRNFVSAWFPHWWYSNSLQYTSSEEGQALEGEIFDVLNNPNDATYLKRDVVFGHFNFSLKQGSVKLCSCLCEANSGKQSVFKSVIDLQVEKVLLGFEYRPRTSSYRTTIALGSIYLRDKLTKETAFPLLVSPQGREGAPSNIETKSVSRLLSHAVICNPKCCADERLFQLSYEYKPLNSSVDYRIHLRTQSLDIVYNPEAVRWLSDFFAKPLHQSTDTNLRTAARKKYQAIKAATKNELIKNWEQILAGDLSNRKTWDIELDISAPQIIFVEHFNDKNAVIVVVDFGRLHFTNCTESDIASKRDSDDEEAFQTPCSTPPGSEASPIGSEPSGFKASSISELKLHEKLYDRYSMELSEMQVLIGKVRDNWKHAHLKGTSVLHVLDRFNIAMQVERRLVYTTDPQFPGLTFSGTLPRLVVHINEQKISALRAMLSMITDQGLSSPFRSPDVTSTEFESNLKSEATVDQDMVDEPMKGMSKLIIMQFIVQQLALEVQSRNRSIAELQVSGVRAACNIKPFDTSITLSVHSLLLVDALQTFGRDFELLVASHKHVGMDSVSGSMRDSEPTSPVSPASPEPSENPASPVAISQALNTLQNRGSGYFIPIPVVTRKSFRVISPVQHNNFISSPSVHPASPFGIPVTDTEALIMIELTFVSGSCPGHDGQPLQIAAIQFNNLDIIANQETIVELLGFARRVFPPSSSVSVRPTPVDKAEVQSVRGGMSERPSLGDDELLTPSPIPTKVEATFDFHRLNVLLLRAVAKDGVVVGRKICTTTMMQAKIKATVGEVLIVEGSLGGIQIVDLTPEGQKHQRILSLGADPLTNDTLTDLSAGLYSYNTRDLNSEKTAFSFSVKRPLRENAEDCVDVKVRLASVWYTHSPLLVRELESCATEFKQYLSNLAKSIKSAATEMAIGFVHARAESLAQSLSMSGRLSASIYGGSTSEMSSPKRRRKSFTQSVETLGNTPHTPYSPCDDGFFDPIDISLDVVLDTPVIILPMSPSSDQVFVAHLGKITARNSYSDGEDTWGTRVEKYHIEIRDMNLYSLTANTQGIAIPINLSSGDAILPRPDQMYPSNEGKPILHNTVIEIVTERIQTSYCRSWDFGLESDWDSQYQIQVSGFVVGPLKVSLSRQQYKQLLETVENLVANSSLPPEPEEPSTKRLGDIQEEGSDLITGVSMLSLDPALRARMLNTNPIGLTARQRSPTPKPVSLRVNFGLPVFTVQLTGDLDGTLKGGLVSISFRDFVLNYDQTNSSASYLQMCLKSLVMEDLLVPENSKNRFLVVSSAAPEPRTPHSAVSQSCPDLTSIPILIPGHQSLPDRLCAQKVYPTPTGRSLARSKPIGIHSSDSECPCTPPPSPRHAVSPVPPFNREENLVLINVTMVDREAPNYASQYESMDRLIAVDFNCLDVIANIKSWVVVFDFFGIDKSESKKVDHSVDAENSFNVSGGILEETSVVHKVEINSKLDLKVRSLTLVLIRPEYEVAKANISLLTIKTRSCGSQYNWEGRLGSMSITDLTPHGKLYKERFLTTGNQALRVHYMSYGNCEENRSVRSCDSEFRLEMSSVVYVHTQRFLGEVNAYFHRFSQLQAFMAAIRSPERENVKLEPSSRMLIEINAGSPVLLLPLSSLSPQVLVADLGKLTVRNKFRTAGSEGATASTPPEGTTTVKCLLDIMSVDLVNMDLFAGRQYNGIALDGNPNIVDIGVLRIIKEGPSLLPNKCHLKLQIDRNLDTHLSREVPDVSVKGLLNKLEASLDLSQYKLIRGLLSYNIGENMQDLYDTNDSNDSLGISIPNRESNEPTWMVNSIHLDLVNVMVHLRQKHGEGKSLACINFIKSRLVVKTFSDRSQDIDLVSAEILLDDTRFEDEPMNKRPNVFSSILKPLGNRSDGRHSKEKSCSPGDSESGSGATDRGRQESEEGTVQAEVHHRRRKDFSKATVLLHNMRLMAVLDWWEIIRDYIMSNADPVSLGEPNDIAIQNVAPPYHQAAAYVPGPAGVVTKCPPVGSCEVIPFEFKLNITDSEIVLVEDTSVRDSNAIILKSTTVVSYRPEMLEKPLFCLLNHCEVFSCILGLEEETALSIIDPVTVRLEVTLRPNISEARGLSDAMITSADRTLEVQMQHLCVRLSYHDFRMLAQMLDSIPRQTYKARSRANEQESHPKDIKGQTQKLSALGFSEEDCAKALEICSGELDDAALWLTQNATHVPSDVDGSSDSNSPISFQTIEVKLSCLSICVIDDCRDADVPLLELSLSQLHLKQEVNGPGTAKFLFTSDYYNRVLSGWEPFIEPWRCSTSWERSSTSLSKNRLQMTIFSEELLNINVTTTLMELYSMVKDNWTQDYYSLHRISHGNDDGQKSSSALPALRRRSPFVPFALKNDTNSVLWFTVLINTTETISEPVALEQNESWIKVSPKQTVPFTFGSRGKVRHRDTHKVRVHQIAVRVDMWNPTAPVSVDKVGVYFRQADPMATGNVALPPARLVFAITLEGSARKLVTVRSALIIKNNLSEAVEAKLENPIPYPDVWNPTMCLNIPPNTTIPVPLSHSLAQIWIRPLDSVNLNRYHAFSSKSLGWNKVKTAGEVIEEVHQCHCNRDRSYRFVASIRRENFPNYAVGALPQPAHTITLISPLEIINLLPCDLHYSIREAIVRGYIKPGLSAAIHEVDCHHKFEVLFHIENFPKNGTLMVPPLTNSFSCRIKIFDESGRRLDLNVFVQVSKGSALRISVSAPYWIINKTSLPLVFKQEGTTIETAGQFKENEIARVVTPLLFSLSDPDASPTIQARVGALCHPDKNPQWCQHFHLHAGVEMRRLLVSQRDNRPDIVYLIGIHIRPGKGRYRHTNIVTLSPRFQLHNKSSYQLQFAQKCLATTLNDPGAQGTYATAVKECSLAWHWPRLDKDLLLCVRLLEIPQCLWSGGFRIDNDDSFHINVRDKQGKMHFLRVEIVLQNATYFVVFTNADIMPPPVRINNFSQVPVEFYQSSSNVDSFQSKVKPQTSIAYAWDEPLGPACLTLVAPGGATATYDINASTEDSSIRLTYENFIYIAFTATFNNVNGSCSESAFDPLDVESQQLVLDCIESVDPYRVVLNRKQTGVRSQLWRMTAEGQLQHEGSSPPRDPRSKSSYHNDNVWVLDIAGTAPQPTQCVALELRRPDKRRTMTQTWRFTEDGRLCCAHKNMCVQAKDGFFGLRQGSEAVLGPHAFNKQVPIEQAVSRMKMRPGSGCLSVSISSDGPTRVLKIVDPKDKKVSEYSFPEEREWRLLPSHPKSVASESATPDGRETQLIVHLNGGFGISVISRKPPEELLFLHVKGFFMNMVRTASEQTFDCTVQDVQCDNQLFEPQCPVVLYVTRGLREDEPKKHIPAVEISAHKLTSNNSNAQIYKHFSVTVKTLSLCLEERLILKLYAMFGNHTGSETEDAEESDFETQRMVMEATSVHATRYYFGVLKLVPSTVRLSFVTSAKLPPQLQILKRKLGLTLIKFEDAGVELKPFIKRHPFETAQFLINSIVKHFKEELKWRAAIILGSVDFLGNPVGFVNDVTAGFSGLLYEGNVTALVKNVAHGISNSAAKVTESLSDGLGRVILDDTHEETRQRIRKLQSGSSGEHLVAGLKGLGFGILGGFTSVFKQTYEGAASDGFQGLIAGFGKGLVGTVTKPVVGVLDLATETASAVRDSSKSSIRQTPPRYRLPRCVVGPGGLLPLYTAKQSQGQEFLYIINERDYSELLLTYEILKSDSNDFRILISSDNVWVFTCPTLQVMLKIPLENLYHSQPRDERSKGGVSHYIELVKRADMIGGHDVIKKPLVGCDSREVAVSVSEQINYAKALFEERSKTLISSQEVLDEL